MKRIIAAILSFCIVGEALPAMHHSEFNGAITANSADNEMTIVDGKLTSMPNKPNIVVPDNVSDIECSVPKNVRTVYCPASVKTINIQQYHYRYWTDDQSSGNLKSVTVLNPDCKVSVTNFNSHMDSEYTMPISGYTGIIRQKGHEAKGYYYPIGDTSFSCEGEIGDLITYKIDSSYNMTLSGKGTMQNKVNSLYNNHYLKELSYGIESLSIGSGITYICGFEDFVELDTVKIPDTVSVIGERAFTNCTKLTTLNIPNSVLSIEAEAFRGCSELSSFILPERLRSIGKNAFSGCDCKGALTIPASVKSIGEGAFANCSGLKSITLRNPDCNLSGDILDSSFTGTVYGYEGSTAQIYSEKYGYKFEPIQTNEDENTSGGIVKKSLLRTTKGLNVDFYAKLGNDVATAYIEGEDGIVAITDFDDKKVTDVEDTGLYRLSYVTKPERTGSPIKLRLVDKDGNELPLSSTDSNVKASANLATIALDDYVKKHYSGTDAKAPWLGDPMCDNVFSADDASYALRLYTKLAGGTTNATALEMSACDVNGDNKLTADDASLILRYYTKLSSGQVIDKYEYFKNPT